MLCGTANEKAYPAHKTLGRVGHALLGRVVQAGEFVPQVLDDRFDEFFLGSKIIVERPAGHLRCRDEVVDDWCFDAAIEHDAHGGVE